MRASLSYLLSKRLPQHNKYFEKGSCDDDPPSEAIKSKNSVVLNIYKQNRNVKALKSLKLLSEKGCFKNEVVVSHTRPG